MIRMSCVIRALSIQMPVSTTLSSFPVWGGGRRRIGSAFARSASLTLPDAFASRGFAGGLRPRRSSPQSRSVLFEC